MIKSSKHLKSTKLTLNHETVRRLAGHELEAVAGGGPAPSVSNATSANLSNFNCCLK